MDHIFDDIAMPDWDMQLPGNDSVQNNLGSLNDVDSWLSSLTSSLPVNDPDLVDYVLGKQEDSPLGIPEVEEDTSMETPSPETPETDMPSVSEYSSSPEHRYLEDHDYIKTTPIIQTVDITKPNKFITILPAQSKTKIALVSSIEGQALLQSSSNAVITKKTPKITFKSKSTGGRRSFPRLILTQEEKQMCEKDGIELPEFYPLTKSEEMLLKKVRRKIRNKISAQTSRKRKREYVDDMETRALDSERENRDLKRKVAVLESQNKTLITQLKRMQSLILGNKSPGQKSAATALMVLLLSTALFAVPGFKEQYGGKMELQSGESVSSPIGVSPWQSRSLLQYIGESKLDDINNVLHKVNDKNAMADELFNALGGITKEESKISESSDGSRNANNRTKLVVPTVATF